MFVEHLSDVSLEIEIISASNVLESISCAVFSKRLR